MPRLAASISLVPLGLPLPLSLLPLLRPSYLPLTLRLAPNSAPAPALPCAARKLLAQRREAHASTHTVAFALQPRRRHKEAAEWSEALELCVTAAEEAEVRALMAAKEKADAEAKRQAELAAREVCSPYCVRYSVRACTVYFAYYTAPHRTAPRRAKPAPPRPDQTRPDQTRPDQSQTRARARARARASQPASQTRAD